MTGKSGRRIRFVEREEVDTEGSWAISYGDMITLLLSFFILFFSTDQQKDRMNAMEASLLAVLGSQTNVEAPRATESQGRDPAFDEAVRERLAAQVYKVGHKLIVEFPNVSFFGFGKVDLTREGRSELEKFTKLYMPYAGNYVLGIRAYTDHKKVLKRPGIRFEDNLELSALRSVAAMRALQHLGIPLHRMRLGGYGELTLTAMDLAKVAADQKTGPALSEDKVRALARKIVLVIEPEPRGET